MAVERMNYSFSKGCDIVPKGSYKALNNELMEYLGCKHRQHYYKKRRSFPNIPAHIKADIEEIFRKYGVDDPDRIWTITPIANETSEID